MKIVARRIGDEIADLSFRHKYPELQALDPWVDSNIGKSALYSILDEHNTYIGVAMIYNIKFGVEAELGVSINNKPYWGKGYGTAALKFLIETCRVSKIPRVYTKVAKGNERALAHEHKVGMKQYGESVINGVSFILLEQNLVI